MYDTPAKPPRYPLKAEWYKTNLFGININSRADLISDPHRLDDELCVLT
jgi:hypothetical protein